MTQFRRKLMDRLIIHILESEQVTSAITLVIVSLCGVGITWLNLKRSEMIDLARSSKRSGIRNEYLSIYNSKEFTWTEKWNMTRDLSQQYFIELHGNHYIHSLELLMQAKMEEEQKEENSDAK